MNSLTDGALAEILNQLLADAAVEREQGRMRHGAGRPGPQDRTPGDFRAEFNGAEHRYMAVSPATGKLLYSLGRSSRARAAVEFGTSFGVSTLFLAAAIKDNGGGQLIGTEFEPTKVSATRRSVDRAGVGDIVEIREGGALATLSMTSRLRFTSFYSTAPKTCTPTSCACSNPASSTVH